MARTSHQTIQKVVAYKAGKHKAKNANLKQATHQGRAVRKSASAQPSFVPVPASVATLPPGQGPPMPSTPLPGGRSSKSTNRRALASISSVRAGGPLPPSSSSSPRARGKRKR